MKAKYTGTMLIAVLGFIAFLVISSQPVAADCDKLMEQRAIAFNSMNLILEALEENKYTVTEEKRIEGLELVDKLVEGEDKLAIEWKTNCS